MKKLAVIAALGAALVACKKGDDAAPANGSASGSDPWSGGSAASDKGKGTGTGTSSGAIDCPKKDDTPPPPPVTAKLQKPFFFHATKAGMADVWLFGTIHLGVAPDAIPDAALAQLDKAERFAMEADINDPSLLSSLFRTDKRTLEDELGADTWHKFACAVGPKVANGLQNMKASTAATLLDVQGMPITQPIDLALLQRAKKGGKGIVFLEAGKKQLDLLDKWMDARAIKASLDDLDDTKQKNQELVAAYVAGDDAKAIEMSKDDSDFVKSGRTHEEFQQMMKELLLDRNASWIPEIEDLGKKGPAFVAVGAMHLLGPGSVVDLLQQKGWKVERVTP